MYTSVMVVFDFVVFLRDVYSRVEGVHKLDIKCSEEKDLPIKSEPKSKSNLIRLPIKIGFCKDARKQIVSTLNKFVGTYNIL